MTTQRLAVLGHPVTHSLSPRIHEAFATSLGLDIDYTAIDVPADAFDSRIADLIDQGWAGFNVTVPHKENACRWADHLTGRARRAGAVNTLLPDPDRPGQWLGDTTDGAGLLYDLTQVQGLMLEGRRILVLGAGGAVRGVIEPLLHGQPLAIHIANRTPNRADQLVEQFAEAAHEAGTELTGGGYDVAEAGWDLVINGTAASLSGDVPALEPTAMQGVGACYDMMYSAEDTPFLAWARALGIDHRMDGLGMLVGQAAESFMLWTGQRPEVAPVLAALRAELKTE